MAKERKEKERPLLEKVSDGANGQSNSKFARALGSTDHRTRERGLQALTLWLAGHKNITEKDLMRLWKALFFCFWHSDKAPVQAALADRLGEIMTQVPAAVGRLYFKVFVHTIRREWFGIDRHRMDKFMMLIRKVFAQHLRYLQSTGWDREELLDFAQFWRNEVFLPQDTLPAAGFAYHVADLLLPELTRVVSEKSSAVPSRMALTILLEPCCTAAAKTRDNVMVVRLARGLFESIEEELREPGSGNVLRHLDAQALADRLFELGALQETRALNREALYEASKDIEAAGKQRGKPKKTAATKTKSAIKAAEASVSVPAPVAEKEIPEAKQQKTKKRKLEASNGIKDDPVAPEQQEKEEAKSSGATPSSQNRKRKKLKLTEPSPVAPKAAAAALSSPVPQSNSPLVEAVIAAAAPLSTEQRKSKKEKKKRSSLGAGAAVPMEETKEEEEDAGYAAREVTPSPSTTITTANGGAKSVDDATNRRKSVRFNFKRNLVMTIGQPPYSAEIRTPPTSKPKGSALKQFSTVQPSRLGPRHKAAVRLNMDHGLGGTGTAAVPASAPPKMAGIRKKGRSPVGTRSAIKSKNTNVNRVVGGSAQNSPRTLPSPGSVPRPKAAQFF